MAVNSKNTEKIVAAAMSLYGQKPYSEIMVKDICRLADVSHSSFYSVFSGKDDILLYILRGYKDDFEATMRRLLTIDNDLEKLWVLCIKYLSLPESFGPGLMSAIFSLELSGKLDLTTAIDEYAGKYMDWFVRLVKNCQASGLIRTSGSAYDLVALGMKITYRIVYEWCVSGGQFRLRDRVFEALEIYYNVSPDSRRLWPE